MKSKILVSACLMGFQVRYNGSHKARLTDALTRWQREGRLVTHCPELAAGLPVPRLPAEILNAQGAEVMQNRGQIVESDGKDVTAHYQLAAWLALKAAQEKKGALRLCLPMVAPPAAASLSMMVPLKASANPVLVLPQPCFVSTA